MASKEKAPARTPSARTRGSSSHQQPPLENQFIDTFKERILARGWDFMYEPSIPISLSWVWEFYANRAKKNQREIFMRGKKIPCFLDTIERVLNVPKFNGICGYSYISSAYNKDELDMEEVLRVIDKEGATWWENPRVPIIPARPKKKILNKEAWMWMKLIICNITPTRHETTLSMEIVLLIYALMKNVPVSLPSVMNFALNTDPTKSNHLLPYPMFITKWAQEANVPRYPGDEILKISKSQQFFPFEKWHGENEGVAHPVPPPMPSPVPPPSAHTDIPTSSAFSSPEPSRKDLMRALRRNERIMHRHEQLMLMIHPGLDTSRLEQISSREVSQTQQE
ncbi:hypothetical protein PIB30_046859 [Stylosanthes scabra]|uniref:Putative plant transposon protein domain-containing protein n=1 Tax=Stylosanthes scabra TaxID=79078 RepID=A0ABU6YIW6_9FABA|nr:hypothetical protein [Stylosanthes scabra]